MVKINQSFSDFLSKTDWNSKECKRKAQAFIKFYTSGLVKSSICNQEYFNANLYTNFLSSNDVAIEEEVGDLVELECQCNSWHIEDSIKGFSAKNVTGITYWSVVLLGEYLSKNFPKDKFFVYGDIQCHITTKSKKPLPISMIRFYKIREGRESWLEENLDLYTHNAMVAYIS